MTLRKAHFGKCKKSIVTMIILHLFRFDSKHHITLPTMRKIHAMLTGTN